MQIGAVPFGVIDWDSLPVTEHNHWCSRGHVLLILSGAMETELQDGRKFQMKTGNTYVVGENGESHRSATVGGVEMFIVD